jgi:hypothetical protein
MQIFFIREAAAPLDQMFMFFQQLVGVIRTDDPMQTGSSGVRALHRGSLQRNWLAAFPLSDRLELAEVTDSLSL